jgi:hypothetical protein
MIRLGLAGVILAATLAGVDGRADPAGDVLGRARAYVASWEAQLSGLVAEEHYTQHLQVRFGQSQTVRLKSDVLLVRVQRHWLGFRDIAEVDGRPIVGRTRRLEDLFVTHPLAEAMSQATRISDEGARYNIGSVYRNFNVPTTALQILEPERDGRVEFKLERPQTIEGQPAAVLSFHERKPPTIILDKGARQYIFTRGRLWVDQATGRILATEVRWQLTPSRDAIHMDAAVNVSYGLDSKSGVWVPQRMTEKYETEHELVDCDAMYTGVRQFSVKVSDDLTSPQ